MEFQILDADYFLVEEKPIVRLFGKTKEGKTVCGFYENYSPYFYIEGEKGLELLKGEQQLVKIEKTGRKIIGSGQTAYKITTKNPAKTPEIRERLRAGGINVLEADILYKYRFMADFGLGGLWWVNVLDKSEISTGTVAADRIMKLNKIEGVKKYEDAPLKILALDIECVGKDSIMPDAKKDPIILFSLAFNMPYKEKNNLVLGTRPGEGVVAFESEKELLEEFVKIVNEFDADLITGYNINNFDMPYILERMRQNNIRPMFGRCRQKPVMDKKVGMKMRTTITGRIIVDSFELIKKDYSLMRYGLDFVAEKLLGENKEDVKKSEIYKFWKGGQENYNKLVIYSRKDAVLALNLVVKLNLLNKYAALAKVSGSLLQDVLEGGETGRIENFLLREFNKEGFVFPCKPDAATMAEREKRSKVELKGGFVLEPKKGLHNNVVIFDFKSMYPSIIRTFNICPTTLVKEMTPDLEDKVIKTPVNAYFLKKDYARGIIPRILEELMNKRAEAKGKMKEAKDKQMKDLLHAEQWALKILANAFYGYLGYVRARVYDLALANSITAFGREMIQNTVKKMEEIGYEVIYGDTDSVFALTGEEDMEKIREKSVRVCREISEELPGVMELDFEKVFKRFLPLAKKRYVAWKFEPTKDGWNETMEMKGVETVRRDWCPLTSLTMKAVIDILLKENDSKKAVNYFKDIISKLIKNQIDVNKLVITKSITRKVENYAGVQPHVELVKKLAKRGGEVPGIGDRVGYVIVKGTDLISKRTEDPAYVAEKGLEVDSKYYIENQLLPPLERIFASLGISKPELLGGGRQAGIFDMLKGASPKKEVIKEASFDAANGFICQKCEKFYGRLPLVGVCSCGGAFLFSSLQGPIENLVVG